MIKILTFMKIDLGKTMDVIEELKKIKEIKEINYITGEFDVAISIETKSQKDLHEIFIEKIDKILWIKHSSSNLLLKQWKTN